MSVSTGWRVALSSFPVSRLSLIKELIDAHLLLCFWCYYSVMEYQMGFPSQGSSASFMGSVSLKRLKRVNKRSSPTCEFIFYLLLYSFSVRKLANKFTFMNRFWDPEADAGRWTGVDSPPAGWHLGVAGGRGLSANRKPAAESHSPAAAAPAVSVSMVCPFLPFWKALTAFIKPNKR